MHSRRYSTASFLSLLVSPCPFLGSSLLCDTGEVHKRVGPRFVAREGVVEVDQNVALARPTLSVVPWTTNSAIGNKAGACSVLMASSLQTAMQLLMQCGGGMDVRHGGGRMVDARRRNGFRNDWCKEKEQLMQWLLQRRISNG